MQFKTKKILMNRRTLKEVLITYKNEFETANSVTSNTRIDIHFHT